MPELPEVETSRMGIEPHVKGQTITKIDVREPRLRLIPNDLFLSLGNEQIIAVERRAKYLLLKTSKAYIVIHLGMSGYVRILDADYPIEKHDHVDIFLNNGKVLRYTDIRRFGGVTAVALDYQNSVIFNKLGPEPLEKEFTEKYLEAKLIGKKAPIKSLIMQQEIVVGVGNIYANEVLYTLGIHPLTPGKDLTKKEIGNLTKEIKKILTKAIEVGGTTIQDFTRPDGQAGYFAQQLQVFGKENELSPKGGIIKTVRIAGRNSFYCEKSQKLKTPI